jgi:indolepyruvate ferredoxin oxidoreductase beta subunit
MVMDKEPVNVIICGVGGQGNLLASELLGSAAVYSGFFTTIGETYGASQRGGAVMSHVRISRSMQYGPLIPRGEADIIVGFEPLEVLRVFRVFGNQNTRIIVNPRPNYPLSTLSGETVYPELAAILAELGRTAEEVHVIESTELAKKEGSAVSQNVLLVGCLAGSGLLEIKPSDFDRVLVGRFEGDALELNRRIFQTGFEAGESAFSPVAETC